VLIKHLHIGKAPGLAESAHCQPHKQQIQARKDDITDCKRAAASFFFFPFFI